MSNEAQYYNPIIQAMIANAQYSQQGEQLKAQIQQHKDLMSHQKVQEDIENKRVEQEQQRIENEHELHKATIDNATQLLQAHRAQAKAQALADAQKFIGSGGSPGAYQRNPSQFPMPEMGVNIPIAGTPPGMMDIPGYGQAPVNAFKTKEQLEAESVQHAAAQAGAVAKATGEAQQPFLDAAAQRSEEKERLKQEQDRQNRLDELKINGENNLNVGKNHDAATISAAKIRAQAELAGIKMKQSLGGVDDQGALSQIQQTHEALMNGTKNYSSLSSIEKRAEDGYASSIHEIPPSDGAKYSKTLDSVKQMQDIIDLGRHLAINYSRDSTNASTGGNQNATISGIGTLQRTVPGSDLEAGMDSLKSLTGKLAQGLEGQSRTSDANIVRQGVGIFSPRASQKQNLQKVNDHIKQLQGMVKSSMPATMSPDRINVILKNRGISDFGSFSSQPISYQEGDNIYDIPPEKESTFIKLHPLAKKVMQ